MNIKKFLKLFLTTILIVIFSITMTSCRSSNQGDKVIVKDMLGNEIEVKKNPKKVACVSRTTYDLLIAFGLSDYIDGVYSTLLENEWAEVFDSRSSSRYSLAYEESYETFISRGVDLVFAPEGYIANNLNEHGVPALCVSLYGNPDYSNYVYFFADLVKELWDEEDVHQRVDKWKSNLSNTINEIQIKLEDYTKDKRTIYYVRGDKNKGIGYTETVGSFTQYAYQVLGMIPLHDKFETNKPSAEEICAQNPDVIVIGGRYQKTLINLLQSEPYCNLNAVKNNQIYNIPIGLTMFEQISVFSSVFLCDQANKLYPDLFNYDVKIQIQEISKDFFGIVLTDEEANNMLNGLSREGNSLE